MLRLETVLKGESSGKSTAGRCRKYRTPIKRLALQAKWNHLIIRALIF